MYSNFYQYGDLSNLVPKIAARWHFSTKVYHQVALYCQTIPPGSTLVPNSAPSIVNCTNFMKSEGGGGKTWVSIGGAGNSRSKKNKNKSKQYSTFKLLYNQIGWWQAMDIDVQKMKNCWRTQLKNPIAWIIYSTDNEFNLKCLIREGARTGSCSKMCISFQVVLLFSEQNLLFFKSLLLKRNALKKLQI